MLACFNNYIGIRSTDPETPPVSGLYIDDLPGVDVARMKKIAADADGVSIIEKSIVQACDETCEDALNYRENGFSGLRTNPVGNYYSQSKFKKELLGNFAGLRGLNVELRNPQIYQFSSMVVERLHVMAAQNIATLEVELRSEFGTQTITVSDIEAGKVKTHETGGLKVEGKKIDLLVDHTSNQFYQAHIPLEGDSDCLSCGSARKELFQNVKSAYFRVYGGYGISADIALKCDTDKIKCQLIGYLKYAARWKAAIRLMHEGRFSDRVNFFSLNAKFEEYLAYAESEYQKAMFNVVPSLRAILKPLDTNCFECGNVTVVKRTY